MKKMVMALALAASAIMVTGCAVQPVQVPGVVMDKRFVPQHETYKNTTSAYGRTVYPSGYRTRIPDQYILVIKTSRGMVESVVSPQEFMNTPVGKRLYVETTEAVLAPDLKKR